MNFGHPSLHQKRSAAKGRSLQRIFHPEPSQDPKARCQQKNSQKPVTSYDVITS